MSTVKDGSHEAMGPRDKDKDLIQQMSGKTLGDAVCKNVLQQEESDTSALSCVSCKSAWSMNPPIQFRSEPGSSGSGVLQQEASDTSALSCVSFRSDDSMNPPLQFRSEPGSSGRGVLQQEASDTSDLSCVSFKSDDSMKPPLQFRSEPGSSGSGTETQAVSPKIKQSDLSAEETSPSSRDPQTSTAKEISRRLKAILGGRCQRLSHGLQSPEQSNLLKDVYTELFITEGGAGEVNDEHEVRQIEVSSKLHRPEEDVVIKCNDVFKPLPGRDGEVRMVLTKGVAGIGKTVSVQKFILDWAEGEANRDVEFVFPLPFRELNLIKDLPFSLEGLLRRFFPELEGLAPAALAGRRVVFVFDGLDECRLPLDFRSSALVHDVTCKTSVDVLLVNLMRKNLLPSALVWVTTRPAASGRIPAERVDRLTEIRGFGDAQKEDYFTKNISDRGVANSVVRHLKLSRSLYIMCHIPVFCWISATVLEKMLGDAGDAAVPKTLTQMYTHFLITQTSVRDEKYPQTRHGDQEMISKLGRLAYKQLLRGNLIFYEEDLGECGIGVEDAVTYSGVCTQIFREELELLHGQSKVFCFVHLSIQEYLAALYVHLSFGEGNTSVLDQWNPTKNLIRCRCSSMNDLHARAVDKALQSQDGQFDLFLRFLLGLSQKTNQALLGQFLLPQKSEYRPTSMDETTDYIKFHLKRNLSSEKYINLFHCLNELDDFSLEEEIQNFQRSRSLSKTTLSTSQWAALVFVLLTSGSELNVFDPWKYTAGDVDECLHRMVPVLMASRAAEVDLSKLSNKGFKALARSVSSSSTCVRELKLSQTPPLLGFQIFSEALKSAHCRLEILRLSACTLTNVDAGLLLSALNCNPSHLKELDLRFCTWNDTGAIRELLKNSHCRLEKLKLVGCDLKKESCADLAEALSTNSSLTDLDLSKNGIEDDGIKMLSAGLKDGSCRLRSFSLADCKITQVGCRALCAALKSNPSHIRELCLNRNELGDGGARTVSDLLQQPLCKLEKLSLCYCGIRGGASLLVSALGWNPSHLRELELLGNGLDTSVRRKLSDLQQHESFSLEKLKV